MVKFYTLISYIIGTGRASSPVTLTWDITYMCNLRCKMCFYWNEAILNETLKKLRNGPKELSLDLIKEIIVPKLKRAGINKIKITGGEPFLKKEFERILSLLASANISVTLLSNLTLIDERKAKKIVDEHLVRNFITSIDGPQEVNDIIRGKGSFEATTQGIEYLNLAKKNARMNQPKITVNCVITSYNQNKLSDVIKIAKELDVKNVSFQFMEWQPESLLQTLGENWAIPVVRDMRKVDSTVIMNQVEKSLSLGKKFGIRVNFFPLKHPFSKNQVKHWYQNPDFAVTNKCFYVWNQTRMDPYGNIYPCMYINNPCGNLVDEMIPDIWNTDAYIHLRKELQKKLFPICNKCCKQDIRLRNFIKECLIN